MSPMAYICLGQDSTLLFGNCRRTTSLRPQLDMRRKAPRCARLVARRIPSITWRTALPIEPSVRALRRTVRGGTDTRSSHRRSHRSSRHRRRRDGTRSSGWRRRRHTGSPIAQRRRRWRPPSSSTASSLVACCHPWMRTTALRS